MTLAVIRFIFCILNVKNRYDNSTDVHFSLWKEMTREESVRILPQKSDRLRLMFPSIGVRKSVLGSGLGGARRVLCGLKTVIRRGNVSNY